MNIEIRKAKLEDCEELSYLKREIWETTYRGIYPDEKFDSYNYVENAHKFENIILSNDIFLYVASDNGKLVGYVAFGSPLRPFRDYSKEIVLLYIKKEYQGVGIGKKLFNLGYEYIKSLGETKFLISCNKYNLPAQGFYEKMGGKKVYIDDDMDNKSIPQIKYEYIINRY